MNNKKFFITGIVFFLILISLICFKNIKQYNEVLKNKEKVEKEYEILKDNLKKINKEEFHKKKVIKNIGMKEFSLNEYIFEKSKKSKLNLIKTSNPVIEKENDNSYLEYRLYSFNGDLYSFYIFLFNIFNNDIKLDNLLSFIILNENEYQIYIGVLMNKNEI